MRTLTPLPARTSKQMLRRLHASFTGQPLAPGHPLTGVAAAMPTAARDAEIMFLALPKSNWITHVILVDGEGKVIVDHNTFLHGSWQDDKYNAVSLGGRPVTYEARKRMSIEEFVNETQLHFTLSQRTPEPKGDETDE